MMGRGAGSGSLNGRLNGRLARRAVVVALGLALTGCGPAIGALAGGGASGGTKAAAPRLAAAATSDGSISGWLHTSGSKILDAGGHTVTIRAANWFGLETSNCTPHGLWTISLDSALDQIRRFGFNAIRLPYANQCLDPGATANSIDYSKNPALVGKSPLQIMDTVIKDAGARGLKIILDRHRPDTGSQSDLWYTSRYSEARWISDWKMLAARYKSNNTVIGADLHNEPHNSACWGCGDASRDWAAAATRAGNAVLASNPNLLVIVEGVEHQADGSSTWWGGGLRDAKSKPIKLASAGHLVYSPHDYPASVYGQSWFSASNYPNNLPGVWDRNWGYLATGGTAPVLLGEFGTKLETTSDKQWLATLVSYLQRTGISYAYWSFNPNSGDTGGLVKDDWVTPQAAKLAALKPILGAGTPAPTPTPKPTPTPTPTPTPKPTPTPAPTSAPPATGGGVSASWTLQSSWQNGPGSYGYVAQLVISSASTHATWSVSWPDAGAKSVANSWGMTCKVASGRISCTGSDWAKSLSGGQPLNVGLQVSSGAPGPAHPTLTVTG